MYNINQKRLIDTFLDCVKIPSPSWKEDKIIEYIIKACEKLKIPTKKIPCGNSYNLLARLEGDPKRTPILLCCHTDTVHPCEKITPVIKNGRIYSDGTSVLGGDDKSAVAAFLEAVRYVRENNIAHGTVEILFTCAEEIGLYGMKGMDLSLLKSKYGFIFDCGGPIGSVIVKAPYQIIMKVGVTGKAAHAGIEPEKGINAIRVLSQIIAELPNGRLDHETTTSVGLISGGKATNIVPEYAEMSLEIRSIDRKKLKQVECEIKSIIKKTVSAAKARAEITSTLEYPGFSIKESDPVIKLAASATKRAGLKLVITSTGGGSDTNILNHAGLKSLNLSIGMQKVHTTDEFILIDDMVKGTRFVIALIESA